MTKKQKRKLLRQQRLDEAFEKNLGAQEQKCSCGTIVKILPLNRLEICPSCNKIVNRK